MNTLRVPHPLPPRRERHAQDRPRPRRRHKWIVATIAVAVGLLAYGAGLGWFANRLADDLSATIQPIQAPQVIATVKELLGKDPWDIAPERYRHF